MKGYLLMWSESGDEIHIDLISPEDAAKFDAALGDTDAIYKIEYEPLIHCSRTVKYSELSAYL